jgi:cellobiose phosphorylase
MGSASNQDLLGFMHLILSEPASACSTCRDPAFQRGCLPPVPTLTARRVMSAAASTMIRWLVLAVAAYIKETGDWDI